MNIKIITASAGTGKTYRLTAELEAAIESGRVSPENIVATTFTTQAAAELVERARARLLRSGQARSAERILAARIGTVNSVCGSFVDDFAFELGFSPAARVLDEEASDVELRRALARVVTEEQAEELDRLRRRFELDRDWRIDVRHVIEAARANGLGAGDLAASAARSCRELFGRLGPATTDDLDAALATVLESAISAITSNADETKGTAAYLERIRSAALDHASARGLGWGAWASLAKDVPTKQSLAHAVLVQQVAARHVEHPRLRLEVELLITRVFEIAAASQAAYQEHKREHGVIDFIDQESLALELLRRSDVRSALAGQIELVLVDEFQDTSPLQLALFLELASLASESIWVGDPKQAIYGFRGTDPSLMDAAIEALTSIKNDPDLVESAARSVGRDVETLNVSYRSRPGLVAVTSEIFARALASQSMPEARTRLIPHETREPEGLGPILEYWPVVMGRAAGTNNEAGRAAALASGVKALLARTPRIRDRDAASRVRDAGPRDVAVLCRTNKQSQAVAEALGSLGVPAIVPRMGLMSTAEARVVHAGLALLLDPEDAVAAAELARIVSFPDDLDAFVERLLGVPGRDAFRDEPVVAKLLAARAANRDLEPVAAIEVTIDATDLRRLCAEWGNTALRLANLDALRAHGTIYTSEAAASGYPATLAGLVRHFESLAPRFARWDRPRRDRQALVVGEDAVTVMTWHRAKGLEWPITILFGLESVRTPSSFGVHVMSDRSEFDVKDPLGGRWIRFWPNPYTTPNQLGAVRSAVERTDAHAQLVAKADREALRVLYVGWTRARDRLVLAAQHGKLFDGLLGKLVAIDPALVSEPTTIACSLERVRWASVDCEVQVVPMEPTATSVTGVGEPGWISVGRGPCRYPISRLNPSTAAPVSCRLGEMSVLGPRLWLAGNPDLELLGDALHAFFASDDPRLDLESRAALAQQLLDGHRVGNNMRAVDVVEAGDRLWRWIENRFEDAKVRREWPIVHRLENGSTVIGTADLVIAHRNGLAVIDHKAFPGNATQAAERAREHSGQLAAYADALNAADGVQVTSTWIHFSVRGCLQEVRLELRAEEDRDDPR